MGRKRMRAMVLTEIGQPLQPVEMTVPTPGPGQVLVHVSACAVCRTDLHVVDGELPNPRLPLVPGHEIVGRAAELGAGVTRFRRDDRIGIPWLGWTCGTCPFCLAGRENLCDAALFTGYTRDGGYAEYTVADERFCFPIPEGYRDAEAAPLLCAGLIGYRSLVKAGDARRLGLYGFGAAAHIVAQVARHQGRDVFAFTRPGDAEAQRFATSLGAVWAGDSTASPPVSLDAAIIFAPAGSLVPQALQSVAKGGTVVCGGIHMSDIPSFPYSLLWAERTLCSVANLTRRDAEEFLALAPRVPVRTQIEQFPLSEANEALRRLRHGQLQGAAVLVPGG
jgi:alcohol dehydrogenase, propanol-preferring